MRAVSNGMGAQWQASHSIDEYHILLISHAIISPKTTSPFNIQPLLSLFLFLTFLFRLAFWMWRFCFFLFFSLFPFCIVTCVSFHFHIVLAFVAKYSAHITVSTVYVHTKHTLNTEHYTRSKFYNPFCSYAHCTRFGLFRGFQTEKIFK